MIDMQKGFNPCRVFWCVATVMVLMCAGVCYLMFQSLSGFLVRCDIRSGFARPSREVFQSLSGFLVRCDIMLREGQPTAAYLFQSLSGFLVRCDGLGD